MFHDARPGTCELNRQRRRRAERHAVDARIGRGRIQTRSGSRSSTALIASVVSIRASGIPRHTCGPAPNVRCAMFVRVASRRTGPAPGRVVLRIPVRRRHTDTHTRRDRVPAQLTFIASVLPYNNSAELGAEQRARRAHVQTPRVRAVLAHIGAHQPPEVGSGLGAGGIASALKLRDPGAGAWAR